MMNSLRMGLPEELKIFSVRRCYSEGCHSVVMGRG